MYSMAAFTTVEDEKKKSLVELIQDTTKTSIFFGNFGLMVQKKKEQDDADERAHRTVTEIAEQLEARSTETVEEEASPLMKMLRKILTFVAKRLVKYIVRPIIRFAIRVTMNLVRFALRSLVTYVIEPVIASIVGFALANPITAAVIGAALLAGGGYYIWRKFFKEETVPPAGEAKPEVTPPTEAVSAPPSIITRATRAVSSMFGAPAPVVAPPVTPVSVSPTEKYVGKLVIPDKSITDVIVSAAKTVGVDPGIMMAMASAESNFNPNARAGGPGDTAGGLFQFVDKTWRGMVQRYGGNNAGPGHGITLDQKFDPRANSIMGALFLRDNAATLKKYGVDPNAGNLYMAHFLGPDTAAQFIKSMQSNPSANAALLYPDAAKHNKTIFYDKNGYARTLAEVYGLMTNNNLKVTIAKAAAYNLAINATSTDGINTLVAESVPKVTPSIVVDKKVQALPTVAAATSSATTMPSSGTASSDLIKGPGKTIVRVS